MSWVLPPPPADDEVIFTDASGKPFTWGEHRQIEGWLAEAEADNPALVPLREKLEQSMEQVGFTFHEPIRVCEFCSVQEYSIHKISCPSYETDARVTREAGGYQYLDADLQVVWTTSIPRTDEIALKHFENIQLMHEDIDIVYITRRAHHEPDYKMMPWRFDRTLGELGEVVPIKKKGA